MKLYVVDVIISCGLTAPFTVMFWRGMWNLQHHYILPQNPLYNHWTLYGIGVLMNILIYFTQSYQTRYITSLSTVPYVICSRLYTLVFGFGIVSHWQGLWLLLDYYTLVSWFSVPIVTSIAVFVLLILRSYCNTISPPGLVQPDWYMKTHFESTTRFRCNPKKSITLFILDVIFNILVIHGMVIAVWRGIWESLDLALFPDNTSQSAIYSLSIGYLIRIIVASIQSCVVAICRYLEKKNFLLMLLFEDFHTIVLSISCVAIWRGLWFVQDLYLFSFNSELSNWVSVVTGSLGLIIMGTFNSVFVRGCNLDGGSSDGHGVICSVGYFSRLEVNITERIDLLEFKSISNKDASEINIPS